MLVTAAFSFVSGALCHRRAQRILCMVQSAVFSQQAHNNHSYFIISRTLHFLFMR